MSLYQRTLVIIKTETISRGLVGHIIQKFEYKGLEIIGLKMTKPSISKARSHYRGHKNWKIAVGAKTIKQINTVIDVERALGTTDALEVGERVLERSIQNLIQGPIILMVLAGDNAIDVVKKIAGNATPETSSLGTIRGDLSNDTYLTANNEERSLYNVIHRSKDKEEAQHEINLWFKKSELYDKRT